MLLSDMCNMMNKSHKWSAVEIEIYCFFSPVAFVVTMLFIKEQLENNALPLKAGEKGRPVWSSTAVPSKDSVAVCSTAEQSCLSKPTFKYI